MAHCGASRREEEVVSIRVRIIDRSLTHAYSFAAASADRKPSLDEGNRSAGGAPSNPTVDRPHPSSPRRHAPAHEQAGSARNAMGWSRRGPSVHDAPADMLVQVAGDDVGRSGFGRGRIAGEFSRSTAPPPVSTRVGRPGRRTGSEQREKCGRPLSTSCRCG